MPVILRKSMIIIHKKKNKQNTKQVGISYLIQKFATTQRSVFLHENYTIYENYPHGTYRRHRSMVKLEQLIYVQMMKFLTFMKL